MTLRSTHIRILILLLGSVSAANAQVTTVAVAPSPAILGQSATVTVTGGSAPCGAVEINYGDGMTSTYPISTLPLVLVEPHTWNTVGNKTIVATGQGNCTGTASVTVQVTQPGAGSIAQLCARVDCGERPKMSFLKPEITTVYGLSTPGGILAITGNNFGTKPGSVVASLRTWSGGSIQRTLEVTVWTNTMVGVRWPADIRGVRQQSGAFALTNAGGKRDWRSVTFSPELDLKTLPLAEVRVVSCGFDGNFDQCNLVSDESDEYGATADPLRFGTPTPSIFGRHGNMWSAVGNDSGTDTYQIVLKRDWVMESFHWRVDVEPGEGSAFEPSGFTKGPTWSPSVTWNVSPDDSITYIGVVTIVGPVGVPY